MLKALNDCVIIEQEPVKKYAEHMNFTHIVIPEKFEYGPIDPPVWGKVVSMGLECKEEIRVGDRVMIGKWSGARLKVNGTDYQVVREYDVLALDDGS